MKLAFWGLKHAFDFFQIGGTESFVRRLSAELIKNDVKVDYILYGDSQNKEFDCAGINLNFFASFNEALKAIERKEYEHIITIYLLPKDRIKYALFRKNKSKSIRFHFVYFGWPDSLIKRKLYFSEARIFPYNGKLFCISKRQYDYVSRWAKNAVYLLPPVPESFFLRPDEKPTNGKIKVTFLGRIDPGKGINEVIEIFKALKDNNHFECSIYGIHIPEHKESFEIHNRLKNQKEIKYIEVDRQKFSPEVEEFVKNVFKETDVFIQPYQKLSSTIDTPLLLLETMASLCSVITKPFGNIPDIYGKSKFLIHPDNFIADAIQLLKNVTHQDLIEERKRIYGQNLSLNFKSENIGKRFVDAIISRD
jgi:glycosyltransferase involved in cell wall biosynthesis